MANHWPIVAAIFIISCAAALGMLEREKVLEGVANSTAAPVPEAAAPAPQIPAAPVEKQVAATPARTPEAPRPTVAVNPVATPLPLAAAHTPGAILLELSRAIQAQTHVTPLESADGQYSISLPGAQVKVVSGGAWSITVYNNPKTPGEDSDDFKLCMNAISKTLGSDFTHATKVGEDGIFLRTTSKLGDILYARNLDSGKCMINPVRQKGPPPAEAKPQAEPPVNSLPPQKRPAIPAPPTTPPATPPKPPPDLNF